MYENVYIFLHTYKDADTDTDTDMETFYTFLMHLRLQL